MARLTFDIPDDVLDAWTARGLDPLVHLPVYMTEAAVRFTLEALETRRQLVVEEYTKAPDTVRRTVEATLQLPERDAAPAPR